MKPVVAALIALACATAGAQPANPPAGEQVWIPMKSLKLEATLYRPPGVGPFPVLLWSHGSTGGGRTPAHRTYRAEWLAPLALERGLLLLAPMRRGRGASEGAYEEPETCNVGEPARGFRNAFEDMDAIVAYLKTLREADTSRLVLAGASRGGILSVAYAAERPGAAVGSVNFVGGWVGDRCGFDFNGDRFEKAGKASRLPTLWLYGAEDHYYSVESIEYWAGKYRDAGGDIRLQIYPRGAASSGHYFYGSSGAWRKEFGEFLDRLGFPVKVAP